MKGVMSIFVAGGLLFYSAAPVFAEEEKSSEELVDCGELESSLEVEALEKVHTVEDLAEDDQKVDVECDSGEWVSSDKEEVVHNEELETAEAVCSKVDMGEEVSIEEDAEDESLLDAELISSEVVELDSEHVELADEEESLTLLQDDSTEQQVCVNAETADENMKNSTKEDAVLESEDIDDLAPSKQTEAVVEAPGDEDNEKTGEESEQTETSDVEEERDAEEHVSEVASADPTIGNISTASVGNSPIIQTDIEIETIAPSGTSINRGSNSNSNNSSGNGNSSNSNGTGNNSAGSNNSTGMNNSTGSNNSLGTNNTNSRPTANQQSGSQSNQGTSSNRLPQTGGVMDQTRVILLSGLMILVGAVLRITSSRKRKFD